MLESMTHERTGLAILLWATDPEQPERCATPFFHAATAAAMDLHVEIYFSSRSVQLLQLGVAEKLRTIEQGGQTIAHFMHEAHRAGVRFLACSSSVQGLLPYGCKLITEVDGFAGAGTFVARTIDPAWATLVF